MDFKRDTGYDTKKILEQMKEEYWRGLAEVEAEEVGEQVQLVTVTLGDELYGISATEAKEIMKLPSLVEVPRTPPTVLGIFNLRGKITSVIDIRPVIGLKTVDIGESGRVVFVEAAGLSTGVIVEGVREIITISREKIVPVAKAISHSEYMVGQADLEGQVMVLLDIGKIISAPDFQA